MINYYYTSYQFIVEFSTITNSRLGAIYDINNYTNMRAIRHVHYDTNSQTMTYIKIYRDPDTMIKTHNDELTQTHSNTNNFIHQKDEFNKCTNS